MRVIIESPYAGDTEKNLNYLAACIQDSLARGEAPFASHGFYTQYLDDKIPEQRRQGMEAGFEWLQAAEKVAVYIDLGITDGMEEGMFRAERLGIPIEKREILRDV